jgi:phosphate transport system protein
MERHFVKEIEELKITINKMASLVDEQVENSFKVLSNGIAETKKIKQKDREVDAYDNLIMAKCENLLALYQPVASDLRFILTAIKVDSQLERCGDIAVNIVQRVKRADNFNVLISDTDLPLMAETARIMVKDAISSFINRDTELANTIWVKDDVVDELNKKIFNQLVEKIKSNPEHAESCAHLIVMARHIERLADHATNISEDVIFLTDNEIVAHKKKLTDFQAPDSELNKS